VPRPPRRRPSFRLDARQAPAPVASSSTPTCRARRPSVARGRRHPFQTRSSVPRRSNPRLSAFNERIAVAFRRRRPVVPRAPGRVAVGRRGLGLTGGKLRLEEKQAAAAVGQIRLAHAWKDALEMHGLSVAQILLTLTDTEERRRYLNARSTLNTLLRLGAVPVINENDTVATAEIRYGDNDRLAARVAQMVSADCLVLLSDVEGLYTADPARDPNAKFVPEIRCITPEIESMAGGAASTVGSGGM